MKPKFLVDTSVWVDFYRNRRPRLTQEIASLLESDEVSTTDVILAELLQGAADEKEFEAIDTDFKMLHWFPADTALFHQAAKLSFDLRRKGITVALTDALLAATAIRHGQLLITKDSDFRHFHKLQMHLLR